MISVVIATIGCLCRQVCSAKMADFRCKFSDAARRYIQLSYEPALHQDERMMSLKRAMICTILSSAGITVTQRRSPDPPFRI